MSEYAKNIQTIEDVWKKRIELPEIVRCRDCAYICNHRYANGLEWHTCGFFDSRFAEVEPDGFCAWGERHEP